MAEQNEMIFTSKPWEMNFEGQNILKFQYGTCEGIYEESETEFGLICVINTKANNGDFNLFMNYIEQSRKGKRFTVHEIWNEKLFRHLQTKRGFNRRSRFDLSKQL